MKFIAIIIFTLLSIFWYYLSWLILKDFNTEIYSDKTEIITAILLAWVFIFWFLLAKLIYSIKAKNKEEEKNNEEDFFLPQIKEVEESTYNNYDDDSETTKESIDVILDKKKKNSKHRINLKEEILTDDLKLKLNIDKKEELIDNTFLNVSNNIKKKNKQDLKIIEWIGPKIEELLNKWWIYSYKDLELSDISDLKNILEDAWSRYMLHNPTTWPKQAQIANSWNFDELKKYQDKLIKWIEK